MSGRNAKLLRRVWKMPMSAGHLPPMGHARKRRFLRMSADERAAVRRLNPSHRDWRPEVRELELLRIEVG